MTNDAQTFLDALRTLVSVHYPGVKVVQSASAKRTGEDRYEFAPRNSLYVQAPVNPVGTPRNGLRHWRYSEQKPGQWVYTRYVTDVYRTISELAERQGHRDVRRGQGGAP